MLARRSGTSNLVAGIYGHDGWGRSSHGGPFHNRNEEIEIQDFTPWVAKSAGLSSIGTCDQWSAGIYVQLRQLKMQGKCLQCGWVLMDQHMTILKSVHAYIWERGIERSCDADCKSLDRKCAATNSSLGFEWVYPWFGSYKYDWYSSILVRSSRINHNTIGVSRSIWKAEKRSPTNRNIQ